MTVICWIRRDVRLHDAPALHSALARASAVPAFILGDVLLTNAPLSEENFVPMGGEHHSASLSDVCGLRMNRRKITWR